jgi:hypothetical protein
MQQTGILALQVVAGMMGNSEVRQLEIITFILPINEY